uniref:Uncharacterized protein n=1 Tax=Rahnella aquatilis TaxID=34038 RepID=D3GN10_RAHAQ|nr:hypothetical protein [Rahnella aquatilis]
MRSPRMRASLIRKNPAVEARFQSRHRRHAQCPHCSICSIRYQQYRRVKHDCGLGSVLSIQCRWSSFGPPFDLEPYCSQVFIPPTCQHVERPKKTYFSYHRARA